MIPLLKKFWTDEAYFRSSLVLLFGVVLPNLPWDDITAGNSLVAQGAWWLSKLAVPAALLVKAGEKNAVK